MHKKKNTLLRTSIAAALSGLALANQVQAFSFEAGGFDAQIYGYARLNVSYDIDANLSGSGTTTGAGNIGAVPTGDTKVAEGHFEADAHQTRFGVSAKNKETDVGVKLEYDFASNGLRLRHAYLTHENWLAGQTWTNFTSFLGNTSTLDFNSTYGLAGFQSRFSQVRYTDGGLSFSIEDPRTTVAGSTNKKDGSPTLTARYEQKGDSASFAVAGLVRQVSIDDGTNDEETMGYGAFVAAKLNATDSLTIQGALNYADGASTYLYVAPGPDAYVDGTSGSLETVSGTAATLGMGLKTDRGSVNLGYGFVELDLDDAVNKGGLAATTHERRANAFLNYQHKPAKNLMTGVELGYFEVEEQSGLDGDAMRILFAAQYNF